MQLASVFLLLAVFFLVAVTLARPFMTSSGRESRPDTRLTVLQAEREHVLAAVQELDLDHALGKVPQDEYPLRRAALLKQGAGILRQLDELTARHNKKMPVSSFASKVTDEELEDLIASRRSGRKEKTGGFCPGCGKPVLVSDAFCPSCGHSLKK